MRLLASAKLHWRCLLFAVCFALHTAAAPSNDHAASSQEEKEEPSVIVLFAIWIEHEIVVLPERFFVCRTP